MKVCSLTQNIIKEGLETPKPFLKESEWHYSQWVELPQDQAALAIERSRLQYSAQVTSCHGM
jgi:hypothetical protein